MDDDVHRAWPRVPAKERFSGKVDVKDWSSGGPFEALAGTAFMERSLWVRSALRTKELRDAYEQRYRAQIDWNEVARKDRVISQLISEIFEVPQDLKQENLRGPGRK